MPLPSPRRDHRKREKREQKMMTDEEAGREVCENPLFYVLFQQALANLGVVWCKEHHL